MFIISLTHKSDLSEVDKHMEGHMAYIDKYYEKGYFISSGRKVPRTGGVILARVPDREELENIVQEDPLIKANVSSYEIIEFIPTRTASGFENLVDDA